MSKGQDPTFPQGDFDLDAEPSASDKAASEVRETTSASSDTKVAGKRAVWGDCIAWLKRRSMVVKVIFLSFVIIAISIGLGVFLNAGAYISESIDKIDKESHNDAKTFLNSEIPKQESHSFSYGDNGVVINNVESKIADTLLKSRPTHMEVSEAIDRKLEAIFSDPEQQAVLRAMNREDRADLQKAMSEFRSTLEAMDTYLARVKSDQKSLLAIQSAAAKRQIALESKVEAMGRKPAPRPAKRVVLEPKIRWEVTAMSSSIAIIMDTASGQKSRVAVGQAISGCGHVRSLNVDKKILKTSAGCIITRREAINSRG